MRSIWYLFKKRCTKCNSLEEKGVERKVHEVYALETTEKDALLTQQLKELTRYHRERCPMYNNILQSCSYDERKVSHYSEIPFLPAGLFKRLTLSSLPSEKLYWMGKPEVCNRQYWRRLDLIFWVPEDCQCW